MRRKCQSLLLRTTKYVALLLFSPLVVVHSVSTCVRVSHQKRCRGRSKSALRDVRFFVVMSALQCSTRGPSLLIPLLLHFFLVLVFVLCCALQGAKVTEEFKASEAAYIASLDSLLRYFVHPLKSTESIGIPQEKVFEFEWLSSFRGIDPFAAIRSSLQVALIFGNVEILCTFHHLMFAEMEKTGASIPAVVLKYADFLKMYTQVPLDMES